MGKMLSLSLSHVASGPSTLTKKLHLPLKFKLLPLKKCIRGRQ